jgi:hypothetical protein
MRELVRPYLLEPSAMEGGDRHTLPFIYLITFYYQLTKQSDIFHLSPSSLLLAVTSSTSKNRICDNT